MQKKHGRNCEFRPRPVGVGSTEMLVLSISSIPGSPDNVNDMGVLVLSAYYLTARKFLGYLLLDIGTIFSHAFVRWKILFE